MTDIDPNHETEGFAALGLGPALLERVAAAGFEAPTPIQEAAIPALLEGRDLVGLAHTGTGKTAAFGLPLLQRLDPERAEVQALVLAPTRELAMQVAKALRGFDRSAGVATVYGGQPMGKQIRDLRRGAKVVVGTPGRVRDLLDRGALSFAGLDCVVLDEADEMLKMGFVEDLEAILGHAPGDRPRQTMLFSATMSPGVRRVAEQHLTDPLDVSVAGGQAAAPEIEQHAFLLRPGDKLDVLDRLLEVEAEGAVLVFAQTRLDTAGLAEQLEARGHAAAALHGDMSQAQRELVLGRFRSGRCRVLVATDVAARGLDVEGVELVVNFDPPDNGDAYTHRVGRTGRAGRGGTAITFAEIRDQELLRFVRKRALPDQGHRDPPSERDVMQSRAAALRARLADAPDEPLEAYLAEIDALVAEGHDPRLLAARAARLLCGDRPLVDPETADGLGALVPFRIPFGRRNGVRASDVVAALCKGLGLSNEAIGPIDLFDRHTEVWIAPAEADAVEAARRIPLRGRPAFIDRMDGRGRPRRPAGPPRGNRPHDRRGPPPPRKGPHKGQGKPKRPWIKQP